MRCTIIPEDINQKMGDSIFMFRQRPYYVKYIGANKIDLYELDKTDQAAVARINYNDPDLDFASVPLGYINKDPGSVVYLIRMPVRKVKQGVNNLNTKISFLPGNGKNKFKYNVQTCLYCKAFIDMTQDAYPSLEDALKFLRKQKEYSEIAINRNIALSIDEQDIVKVYFKNMYVGWIQPGKYLVHVKSNDLGWVVSKYLSHVLGWQID